MAPLVRGIDLVYLYVPDVARAARWYEETLGLRFDVFGDDWAETKLEGGQRLAFHKTSRGEPQTPGTVIVDLRTDDIEAARAQLVAKGVRCGRIEDDPSGRHLELVDRDGYRIQLFERAREDRTSTAST
ncbi:MAG TPA: VOC family protein [Candidatus Limnocylindria bacterium]|nr:VOC family protein [Candidatus Limnocylindria bacterium]